MSVVGENIRRARVARQMSQKALADLAGVSQGTIGGLESGTAASTKFLPQIAKALGVKAEEIDPNYAAEGTSFSISGPSSSRLVPSWVTSEHPLPVYSASSSEAGPYIRKERPISQIDRPSILRFSPDAYAQVFTWEAMSPEFRPGDIAYANPDLPALKDTTCLFYKDDTLQILMVGYLRDISLSEWSIVLWNVDGKRHETALSRDEWPICHRIVAKLYRG